MSKQSFSIFTQQYPLQKTLRFSLKPVGKTSEYIQAKGFLEKDETRAEKYKQAKKIIDEYHKAFIDDTLSRFAFQEADLESFQEAYKALKNDKNDPVLKKKLAAKQGELRKKIAAAFKNGRLFNKEFIKKDLPEWLASKGSSFDIEGIENPKEVIESFKKWVTYFGGFNENRKNIYTHEDHSTSIGYRVVHENLPRFIDNIDLYSKAKELGVDFSEVAKNYQVYPDEVFTLAYFNKCLTQKGIESYNQIRGGERTTQDTKEQGINEKINLYAQRLAGQKGHADDGERGEIEQRRKAVRSCTLYELYKQILSDRSTLSFHLDSIESDADLCAQIQQAFRVDEQNNIVGKREYKDKESGIMMVEDCNVTNGLTSALSVLKEANPSKIYIKNDAALTKVSQHLLGKWSAIQDSLAHYAEHEKLGKDKAGKPKVFSKKQQESWLKSTHFSFHEIHSALEQYFGQFTEVELESEKKDDEDHKGITHEMKRTAESKPLFGYFKQLTTKQKNEKTNLFEAVSLLDSIRATYPPAARVLRQYAGVEEEQLKHEKDSTEKIKAYLDALLSLLHFLSPLSVKHGKKEEEKSDVLDEDKAFYNDFDATYDVLKQVIPLYDKTRNYLTKKPYSIEKYKLNFENETLANGWDRNKETENTCVLFKKNEQFFLGVIDKHHRKIFEGKLPEEGDCYQKMVYKLLPGASKMLPKVFFAKKNIDYYNPSEEILNIRNHASHTKGGTPQEGYEKKEFSLKDCHTMIDFFKDAIGRHPEWSLYKFKFDDTSRYHDSSDFYREVKSQGYNITFQNVAESYIDQCVEEGKLYLFRIYNKDFSVHSKGKPNMHTLYWRALFDPRNVQDVVYKLNGEAELFYRKPSINEGNTIHTANVAIENKTKVNGKRTTSTFEYDIIKDRRYTKASFFFHVPITLNFKASGVRKFNDQVNEFLKNNPDINILGIDRGERHLAYYALINQQGEILKQENGESLQGSFNVIHNEYQGKQYQKDYHDVLDKAEKERDKARKSWNAIGKIKELKEGYLSQVVHKICQMAIRYNAIIVFEDLNFGFKRGRFKIEKQVYQKLEKMLIDKLNYLVFKETSLEKPGGLYAAYQLADQFTSFSKMGKQTGIIFYVAAHYTSKVCPATGFVNLLYPRYETVKKAQFFFNQFDAVRYNSDAGYFEFTFQYSRFTNKAKGAGEDWILCTNGLRLESYRNKSNRWDTREVALAEEMKQLFTTYTIDFESGDNLKDRIVQQEKSLFFKQLIRLLKLTLQMRNSRTGTDEDWLISPIKDENGSFFDSRACGDDRPRNADANGAYHIGLKGLFVLQKINSQEKNERLNLNIKNTEWLKFVQDKEYRNNP